MIVLFYGLHDGDELAFGVGSESRPGQWHDVFIWARKGTHQCTCEDFIYRMKHQIGDDCKHIRAVYSEGLPLLDLVEFGRRE